MILFNLYQIILVKYFTLRYLRDSLNIPKLAGNQEVCFKFDIWEVCPEILNTWSNKIIGIVRQYSFLNQSDNKRFQRQIQNRSLTSKET